MMGNEREIIMKTSKLRSTFEREMDNPQFREKFEAEYKEFVLSEIVLRLMEEEGISVRKLAQATGLSPTVIQDIRSGTRKNITMKSFLKIMRALGGHVAVKIDRHYIPIGA